MIQAPGDERREIRVLSETREMGRSSLLLECPFCLAHVTAYKWSLTAQGKRCGCGAKLNWIGGATPPPTTRGPEARIRAALARAEVEIAASARAGGSGAEGRFARGLAGEGYAGGYAQALSDVLLLLGGTEPVTRGYWR